MILQALTSYYERLEADAEADVAPFGFSRQKIAYCVVINSDGTYGEDCIEDLRTQEAKKLLPRSLVVCGGAKPSGSGINPCFLWDNPAYMLGYKPDDPKPERTLETFEAFRQRHLRVETEIDDPEFSAVCRFLERWNPAKAADYPTLVDIGTGFGVFRVRGTQHFVHERKAVREWWIRQLQAEAGAADAVSGQCLVTGAIAPIARLHEPKIKGVWGGQSSGAAIVSFNLDAFESYGKSQSNNAPVSEQAAFQYCTALNRLLADGSRRVQIGDATTVFWTEQPTPAESILGFVFGNQPPEDEALANRVEQTLSSIAQGRYPGDFGEQQTRFFVLGLSPNAARISVRFWMVETLGELVKNLQQHFEDLRIARSPRDPEFIMPWQIVRETVRDSKDVPPLLGGALIRSILTGQPYPHMLLSSLIRRIRADRTLRYVRAAAIKAVLNRNLLRAVKTELLPSLDAERPDNAYHLGRLFAELEQLQSEAQPQISATIRDRYFGAAAANPVAVFPKLITLSQHHLSKVHPSHTWKRSPRAFKLMKEDRILTVASAIHEMPTSLNLHEQGMFAVGFYHQRESMFPNHSASATPPINDEEQGK